MVPQLIAGANSGCFEDENQKGQAHGELWENVVKRNRKGEMQAMNREGILHQISQQSAMREVLPEVFIREAGSKTIIRLGEDFLSYEILVFGGYSEVELWIGKNLN
jgi:hypothetical protein